MNSARRQALAADVADGKYEPTVVEPQQVEEITADLAGRPNVGRHVEVAAPAAPFGLRRQKRALDDGRTGHLVFLTALLGDLGREATEHGREGRDLRRWIPQVFEDPGIELAPLQRFQRIRIEAEGVVDRPDLPSELGDHSDEETGQSSAEFEKVAACDRVQYGTGAGTNGRGPRKVRQHADLADQARGFQRRKRHAAIGRFGKDRHFTGRQKIRDVARRALADENRAWRRRDRH